MFERFLALPARLPRRTGNTGPATGSFCSSHQTLMKARTGSGTTSVCGAGRFLRVLRRTKVHVAKSGPNAVQSSEFRSPERSPPIVRDSSTSSLISASTSGQAMSSPTSPSVSTVRALPHSSMSATSEREALFSAISSSFHAACSSRTSVARRCTTLCREYGSGLSPSRRGRGRSSPVAAASSTSCTSAFVTAASALPPIAGNHTRSR
ncbi:MAG: hypothetical protein QM756_10495 [Polyangiaceae bacterium]